MAFSSTNLTSVLQTHLPITLSGLYREPGWGEITAIPSQKGRDAVGLCWGRQDGGYDKTHGGYNQGCSLASFTPQTMALLPTTWYTPSDVPVCGPYTLMLAYQTVRNTTDDRRGRWGGAFVWLCNQRRLFKKKFFGRRPRESSCKKINWEQLPFFLGSRHHRLPQAAMGRPPSPLLSPPKNTTANQW